MISPPETEPAISAVSHLIQISVAPVFLLTGIGAVLGVMANRLARIVDRARVVEGRLGAAPAGNDHWRTEMLVLEKRARIISTAIAFCTLTALLVCAVIALLFLSALFVFDSAYAIALIFIASMLGFMTGLLLLLREVMLATQGLRFGPRLPDEGVN